MKYLILFSCLAFFSTTGVAQNDSCACCTENHSAFDFWIGEWTVTNTDGSLAGKNSIKKLENNCVLQENWTSGNGAFTGTSLNYYNSSSGLWEQLWIDNAGGSLKLRGSRTGDQMILASDPFTREDGREYVNRITWTLNQDGSVRQLWEVLQEGAVVNTVFDGLYKRSE